jgi:putative ABC transport system permease protein
MITGLYALIAFTTSQRLREIGVRLALGATRASVVGMVVRQAVLLSGLGVAAGVAASMPVARLVETQLFDVRAFDPLTWAGVTIVMVVAMAAACWWPARRASRIDPASVLRDSG